MAPIVESFFFWRHWLSDKTKESESAPDNYNLDVYAGLLARDLAISPVGACPVMVFFPIFRNAFLGWEIIP